MKIGIIAPIIERVPPKKYGGTERVVNVLTESLVKKGHQVTLFASGDTLTSAKLISIVPRSLKETPGIDPYGNNALTALHYGLAYKMQDNFDIIHDHIGAVSLPTANIAKTPVVITMHGPFTAELHEVFSILTKPYLVTISDGQLKQAPRNLNHGGTVYNGLNMEYYTFSEKPGNYLLFVGRITYEKGVHTAVQIAKKLDLPLIIAAKLETNFKPDIEYFEKEVKPYLSDKIRWIGEVTEQQRNELMSKALVFLHPITWAEPFGLTLIESMACGTPVIAFNLGSIPEIVKDGISGYVVESEEEMIQKVQKISSINRKTCRDYALENFSGEKMVEGYLKVYEKILQKEKTAKAKIDQTNATNQSLYNISILPQNFDQKKFLNKSYQQNYAHQIRVPKRPNFPKFEKDN